MKAISLALVCTGCVLSFQVSAQPAGDIVPDSVANCVISVLKAQPNAFGVRKEGEMIFPIAETRKQQLIWYGYKFPDIPGSAPFSILIALRADRGVVSISMMMPVVWRNNVFTGDLLNRNSRSNPLAAAFGELETKCKVTYKGGLEVSVP